MLNADLLNAVRATFALYSQPEKSVHLRSILTPCLFTNRETFPLEITKRLKSMQSTDEQYDIAIVGGGIAGLAIAYVAARRGQRVVLFERNRQIRGASVRNFGMVWPIGQPPATFDRAMRSREIWLDLARRAGFWANPCGSLYLAYHEDELHVLEEFAATVRHRPYQCQMLTPEQTVEKSCAVNPVGLEGALWSNTEVNINPREATTAIHRYLVQQLSVRIHHQTPIKEITRSELSDGRQRWRAGRIYVCSGDDFETLYPDQFARSGLVKCKLQMMRTLNQPIGWQLGPNLASGLAMRHTPAFAHCESLRLIDERLRREMPKLLQWQISPMVAQTPYGEITLGDSRECGAEPSPFDKQHLNQLIIRHLKKIIQLPNWEIGETWHGLVAQLPGHTEFVADTEEHVRIVTGLGTTGITLAFGLALELLGETQRTSYGQTW